MDWNEEKLLYIHFYRADQLAENFCMGVIYVKVYTYVWKKKVSNNMCANDIRYE